MATRTVGVVGGGLIGMSWASLFLARGQNVVIVDPRPELKREFAEFVGKAWPSLLALGLTDEATPTEASFVTDVGGLSDVDFVQESGPDRIQSKRDLVKNLEENIGSDIVIASSSSSLTATAIQMGAKHPARILVAHPMNPPHIIPMVELVAGEYTSELAMRSAELFYNEMKRVTIRVRKEIVGHLANRLTSALYREAVNLVDTGVASVEDIDRAITFGPGMRWPFVGPHLTYHLGGGRGGYAQYLDHLGPTQEARWAALGTPQLTAELKSKLVDGIEAELADQDIESLVERRDSALVDLIKLKRKFDF